jgi:hypothetical protein
MNEIDDDDISDDSAFEQELGRHFAAQLDPQCGHAARAFDAHVHSRPRGYTLMRVAAAFIIGAAGIAAFVWAAQMFLLRHPAQFVNKPAAVPSHPLATVTPATMATDVSPRDVTQLTAWAASDEGFDTVTVADQTMPVRKVRRDAVETTQWFDPQSNAQIKLTVPVQQEILIQEDTY